MVNRRGKVPRSMWLKVIVHKQARMPQKQVSKPRFRIVSRPRSVTVHPQLG